MGDKGQDHIYFYFLGYLQEHHISAESNKTVLLPHIKYRKLVPLVDVINSPAAKIHFLEHIMRGGKADDIKEAMEEALKIKNINEEEHKLLLSSIEYYKKLTELNSNVQGDLEYTSWSIGNEDPEISKSAVNL